MNDLATSKEQASDIWRPSAALNPERLEYLWGLTDRIAWSTSVPETLRGERKGGSNGTFEPFDDRTILANVFAVVEQADRWNISPFALLGAAAIVRGKLAFEGKVIAAVLESQFGVKLFHYFRGEPRTDSYHIYICDEELPDAILAELKPGYRSDRYKILDGSVGGWKTTGNGSPWRPDTYADMLVYRGDRQWARVYKSSAILGVIGDDEAHQLALEAASQQAIPLAHRFAPTGAGFNADGVAAALEHKPEIPMEVMDPKTGEFVKDTGAQLDAKVTSTSPGPNADEAKASAQPADDSAGGAGSPANGGGRPQETLSAEAGGAGSAARVSAALFRDYHSALARYESKETVEKAHKHFWPGKAKLVHEDDLQLAKDIFEKHLLRAEGKVEAGWLAKEIDGWINAVTGGQL